MINPVDVTVFGELARNHQRTFAITRIPEPQRERRVVGIAEPVHRVELYRSVRVPDRSAHRARMPDRQRLVRVTHERQPDTPLDRELDEDVRRARVNPCQLRRQRSDREDATRTALVRQPVVTDQSDQHHRYEVPA